MVKHNADVRVCACVRSGSLDRQTESGNTALHYCCTYEKPECVKLLLRGKPLIDISQWEYYIFNDACIWLVCHGETGALIYSLNGFVISVNQNGETALDIARRFKNRQCEDPVSFQTEYF